MNLDDNRSKSDLLDTVRENSLRENLRLGNKGLDLGLSDNSLVDNWSVVDGLLDWDIVDDLADGDLRLDLGELWGDLGVLTDWGQNLLLCDQRSEVSSLGLTELDKLGLGNLDNWSWSGNDSWGNSGTGLNNYGIVGLDNLLDWSGLNDGLGLNNNLLWGGKLDNWGGNGLLDNGGLKNGGGISGYNGS